MVILLFVILLSSKVYSGTWLFEKNNFDNFSYLLIEKKRYKEKILLISK